MKYHTNEKGFVALMSAVVISAALIAVALSASIGGFYARMDSFGLEQKIQARLYAQSCVQVALLALATSTDALHLSIVSQSVSLGTDEKERSASCVIKSVTHTVAAVIITTYASFGDSFETLSVTASLPPDTRIISWDESP